MDYRQTNILFDFSLLVNLILLLFSISYAIYQKYIETLYPLMAPENLICIVADPLLQPIIVDQWLFYSFTTILMNSQKRKNINLYDTSIILDLLKIAQQTALYRELWQTSSWLSIFILYIFSDNTVYLVCGCPAKA